MSVIVYGRANSINVQKVLWLLDELGEPYERKDVGGPYGFPEGYEKLHPMRQIPAVSRGGVTAWESNAAMRFLAQETGATELYPEEVGARTQVEAWMDWQLMALGVPMRRVFQKTVRGKGEYAPVDVEEINAGMQAVAANLSDGGDLLGAGLTLADFAVAPFVHRWLELEIEKPDLPALTAWRERLRARPAFVRHVDHPLT